MWDVLLRNKLKKQKIIWIYFLLLYQKTTPNVFIETTVDVLPPPTQKAGSFCDAKVIRNTQSNRAVKDC
jgi:hypothetical protein